MACHAGKVLLNRQVFDTTAEAVADCGLVAGTSNRGGLYRDHSKTPREWAPRLLEAALDTPVAILFGSEDNGLSLDDLALCTQFIRIPSSEAYKSLNLAMSVMVVSYELFAAAGIFEPPQERSLECPSAMREAMFVKWRRALLDIGFMTDDTADHMMLGIRRILSRGTLTEKDVQILLGMASQTQWAANQTPQETMTSPTQHILSVLVVALNEERHMAGLKDALDKLHLPDGWSLETILVDGGSRDGTVQAAREAGFDECLVFPGASIPVCRNHALRAARGSALAFLDGDCMPDRDWLHHAAPWLLKSGPVMLGYPVQPPENGNWIHRSWHAHWHHKNTASQGGDPEPVTAGAFRLITTRNMLFNRALLDVVPDFNEALTTGEDTDFAFRATQAGCEVVAAALPARDASGRTFHLAPVLPAAALARQPQGLRHHPEKLRRQIRRQCHLFLDRVPRWLCCWPPPASCWAS